MTKYRTKTFDKAKVNEIANVFKSFNVKDIILDGIRIKNIEELREHFDMEAILFYFASGYLLSWFEKYYYEVEADKISQLYDNDQNLQEKLCEIVGVDPAVFVEEVILRNQQTEELKKYTTDPEILKMVDQIAFNQEELSVLLDKGATMIHLFNNKFYIPLRQTGKKYIGIGDAVAVIRSSEKIDLEGLNISFQNVKIKKNCSLGE